MTQSASGGGDRFGTHSYGSVSAAVTSGYSDIYTVSTQYLHSIYTVSSHYLHSIYTELRIGVPRVYTTHNIFKISPCTLIISGIYGATVTEKSKVFPPRDLLKQLAT